MGTRIGFIIVTLMLVGCVDLGEFGRVGCNQGICVKVQLSEPIRFNELTTAIITVATDKDVHQLGVSLTAPYGVSVEGTHTWRADVKAYQTVIFTGTVRFTMVGNFDADANASTSDGVYVTNYVDVFVTQMGATANPTILPHLPSPQPTISPSLLPIVIPTLRSP